MARNLPNLTDGLSFSALDNQRDTVQSSNLNNQPQLVEPVKPIKSVEPVQSIKTRATRKIGITLTEGNYLYLKEVAFFSGMQMQDYLNNLIRQDRADKDPELLNRLPHNGQFD